MDEVVQAVSRIQSINGARVDRNYRQGHHAMLAQLQARFGKDVSNVDDGIARCREYLNELRAWAAPLDLPDDYVFFLEFYGGLLIETTRYNLLVEGFGPMTEEWYGFILGDDALYENGFLRISTLSMKEENLGRYVHFFLDLAGTTGQYCVIGIDTWNSGGSDLVSILQDPHTHIQLQNRHGESFTEWLEQLAATNGTFGYL